MVSSPDIAIPGPVPKGIVGSGNTALWQLTSSSGAEPCWAQWNLFMSDRVREQYQYMEWAFLLSFLVARSRGCSR